ncbi:Peptide methionine sulfoxide reductase MsrA [Seminavis robusta]|uniref:peptide-methionine (S)-S-oxide reductase n=1 Tax=Seminavis robusta TaxID=568900 RepID=A0A9N8HSH5_9STRA|nr:Peptide methionine sulfoxide reductase MsrA [Seminavis robusta]|eukprot:Sro1722_g293580.1 Peptide methionine sulfoxide reductase MsrA (124) ;mRNA; r:14097-14549
MDGVVRVVVGYSGGKKLNPTYRSIMDHTEALLIEFDPDVVTYEDLLISWSRMHSSTNTYSKCQYRAAVWYLDDAQKEEAEGVLRGMQAMTRSKVTSKVEPVTRFYKAEEYHQNYLGKMGSGKY